MLLKNRTPIKKKALSLVSIMESITEENKKGKMVSIFLPSHIGRKLQDMFRNVPGEVVEPDDMHITIGLMYGDGAETKKTLPVLDDISKMFEEFDVNIDSFGTFPPNEHNHNKHVLWAKPSSENIFRLKDTVFDAFKKHGLKIDNGSFDFNPHITIKYCDEKPETDVRVNDPVFRVKALSCADGGKKYHMPLRRCGK